MINTRVEAARFEPLHIDQKLFQTTVFIQLFSFPILINCLFFQTLLLSRIIVRSVAGLLYRILSFHPDYFVV